MRILYCLIPFVFKLVVLLAITSGQRCQTLTNLDISSMKKTGKYCLFQFRESYEAESVWYIVSSLYVPKYCEQELCIYRTLECYLERTLPVRAVEHTALLLSYVKPFAPVGSSTVGRWIKNLLNKVAWIPESSKCTALEQLAQAKLTIQFE